MTSPLLIPLPTEDITHEVAKALSLSIHESVIIFFEGDLGAGKTTFCRSLIRGLGHTGSVKSPTYTLVEPYHLAPWTVYHFDLYRLGHPEELEYMGIRDYFTDTSISLIEWPMKGGGHIPEPDVTLNLSVDGMARALSAVSHSKAGERLVSAWATLVENQAKGL